MSKYASLLISAEIHKREVELPGGEKVELFFKELPAVQFRRFQIAESSKDADERAASINLLIQASLCEPDGKPALTEAEAMNLKPQAANAIFSKVLEISGHTSGNA